MYPDYPEYPAIAAEGASDLPKSTTPKPPRTVLDSVFAFPPNRETLGGTAYLIVGNTANILIDCPALDEPNRAFLAQQGGVDWLFLTHRGGIGQVRELQQAFNCQVVIQEQEAYLLPGLALTTFQQELVLPENRQVIWTPGHSPGSACLYCRDHGGVLFSGRHLLPNPQGQLMPLKTAKTFHWGRQLRSVRMLLDRFSPETLQVVCPGANLGFLRGQYQVKQAYQQLAQLDLAEPISASTASTP